MHLEKRKLLLLSQLKSFDGLSKDQIENIQSAMLLYALEELKDYQNKEIKEVTISFYKLMLSLTHDNFILWLRQISFKRNKKKAQMYANTTGYKTYMIRNSLIGYSIMNTLEANHNKKLRILGKDVDFKELEKVSSYIAYSKI